MKELDKYIGVWVYSVSFILVSIGIAVFVPMSMFLLMRQMTDTVRDITLCINTVYVILLNIIMLVLFDVCRDKKKR